MLHPERHQRTMFSIGKITNSRLAVLGIISTVIVMMAAALPAGAQQFQLMGYLEAQGRGAVFETIANPNNCPVDFKPDTAGIGASVMVQVDCRQSSNPHNVVTVRLFSRILLNPPWIVAQVAAPGPDVQIRHAPELGSRDLSIELDIGQGGGLSNLVPVFLKISATGTVTKPICPSNRPGVAFLCSSNADCNAGSICAQPCSMCVASPFSEAALPRTITVGEMRDLGYGVEARAGTANATFRIIWEASSRWNLAKRCPVSFDSGRTATESVAAVLNCTARGAGAQASFDMFNGIKLNPPWVVDAANVTPFQLGSGATASASTVPASGSSTVFTRVLLNAAQGQQARAAVSIRIKPVFPDPLPNCIRVGPSGPPICSTNAECPHGRPSGGRPLGGGFAFGPSKCSPECGNRCVNM